MPFGPTRLRPVTMAKVFGWFKYGVATAPHMMIGVPCAALCVFIGFYRVNNMLKLPIETVTPYKNAYHVYRKEDINVTERNKDAFN